MGSRGADIDLPAHENQYGNGYSRGGARVRCYEGDLPEYENQYGSGSGRRKFKNVSFFSKKQNKLVTFKAKLGKKRRRKGYVSRNRNKR